MIGCLEPTDRDLPNIIIIYTDDQGYADLSCYGATDIRTPNIDKLAQEGLLLTDFYVAQPVCTASRVALLTGCYPNRLGMHGALMPGSNKGIHPDETTLAEMLKGIGYQCGIFGKWHLGSEEPFHPLNNGFDSYYGIPYSNDMWPNHPWQDSIFDFPPLPLYEDFQVVDTLEDQSELTRNITLKALEFIETHAESNFLVYIPHPQPHVPLYASDHLRGTSARGLYGDVIQELDWSTGQIMYKLEELDLTDKTWIIFASDNGPWLSYGAHSGQAGPLREGKGTVWEGGVRVPCIMRYPSKFSKGKVINTPVMNIDIMPTIATITGAPMPANPIDGVNVWDVLNNQTTESPQEAYYFYYHTNELQALRVGNYKLILPHSFRTLGEGTAGRTDGLPIPYQYVSIAKPELYDLSKDPGERYDLAEENQNIVDSLMVYASQMRMKLGDSLTGFIGTESRKPGQHVIKE